MGSTDLFSSSPLEPACWLSAGLRYYSRNFFCRKKFGRAVWKVSLDAGLHLSQPRRHRWGPKGAFFATRKASVPAGDCGSIRSPPRLDEGIRRVRARHDVDHFVAYFQPATNTYGPLDRLGPAVRGGRGPSEYCGSGHRHSARLRARRGPGHFGRFRLPDLGYARTRPANDPRPHARLARPRPSRRQLLRRGRSGAGGRGLEIGVHVILGLPGESPEDMLATARTIAGLGVGSVKLHNLYAVRNTRLAEMAGGRRGSRSSNATNTSAYVVDFLEVLSPDCVIDRLSGDAPREYLIGPQWCLDKPAIRAAVEAEFVRRGSWQGCKWKGQGTA